jgi:hypothetical protein
LEIFYNDCLNKDEILDELAAVQEDNIYRRQLEFFDQNKSKIEIFFLKEKTNYSFKFCLDFYYKDPYIPFIKSNNLIAGFEKSYDVPVLMEYDQSDEMDISPMAIALAQAAAEEEEQLQQPNRFNTYFIDSDELLIEDRPGKLIAEESIMSNKTLFYFILSK